MTSADVRARLTHALRLDLIGPEPGEPQASEILPISPSRWYLTGFLVPWNAPDRQRRDEDDTQGEFEFGEAGGDGEDDDSTPEPKAARRSHFPSSMGLSVLVPHDATVLSVRVSWGDYRAFDRDGVTNAEWRRTPRAENVSVALPAAAGQLPSVLVPNSDGLEIVVSVRSVHGLDELRGVPDGTRAVSVFLVNKRDALQANDDRRDERSVFQTQLVIESDRPFVPRANPRGRADHDSDERVADLQYRDVMEFAVGHGTSARSSVDEGRCIRVETTWMPRFEVERVEPAAIDGVELGMDALADLSDAAAAKTALAGLVQQYRKWIEHQAATTKVDAHRQEVSDALLAGARRAASRIERGIELLEDPLAFEAFRLANRAMAMAARQRRGMERGVSPDSVPPPQWRPFQLAFVLMNLQAFVNPAHQDRELVDLLFFPTGGGKTEAYLGLSAFAILLRRLREPGPESGGVAVLMRYTLRLLTLDQLGRASTLICALELIRKDRIGQLGEWPFEIGLWVGKAATPNRMGRRGDNDRTSARQKTIDHQNNSKKPTPIPLETCPWCGTKFKPHSFQLKPDANNPQELRVACVNSRCVFKGDNALPIITVDEPLFRRLPCFVISTVDKFANLPWVGQSGALLGGADRHSPQGFFGAAEPNVGQPLAHALWPPDLVIQDELHLISGPLGTMAGLYETAIDALSSATRDGRPIRPKVVASTATVRRATDQIRALFGRSGVEVFPPPGPDRRTSFFAETRPLAQQPGRLYVGLGAQGRSLKVVLLRTYLALLAAAQKAWNDAGGEKTVPNPADPYMTLVGYFGSLRELGGSRRIVEDEVASRVSDYSRQRRLNEGDGVFANRPDVREVAELTSRESTSRVSDTKRRLALGFADQERVDVALATNMISVGLDITRLGIMVVLGQPKAAAEYIQASSRVGRDPEKPGLVVTLMNVHRPRDRSHIERFEAFHAAFYRSVEATSVTPFSARAVDRALPAVAVALARHQRRSLTPPAGAVQMAAERPQAGEVADVLVKRVRAHRAMSADEEAAATSNIRARANDLLDSWFRVAKRQRDAGARLVYQPYEGVDGPPLLRMPLDPTLGTLDRDAQKFKAPRSLRDVEAAVNLWVKTLDNVPLDSSEEVD